MKLSEILCQKVQLFSFICTKVTNQIVLCCFNLFLPVYTCTVLPPRRSICYTCRLWIRGPRRPTWSTGWTPTATLAVTGTTDTRSDGGDDRGYHKSPLSLQTPNADCTRVQRCANIHSNIIICFNLTNLILLTGHRNRA